MQNFCSSVPIGLKISHSATSIKQLLKTNKMLTDEHIQAAQNLLKKQFRHLAGLQSTLLFQNKGFSPALISDGSFREGMPL